MLRIDVDSPVPLVEQVRNGIRRAIAAGELTAGDHLPTVRQLGQDLGINLNTVARAYRQLEADGLVSAMRRRGTVVRSEREDAGASPAVLTRLREETRNVLASARLAGLTRDEASDLFDRELGVLWSRG